MWCVYRHTCPNGKVYIGITGRDPLKRWKGGFGYRNNDHFSSAIMKYGWDNIKHEILFDGLTKSEAEAEEIKQIKLHRSTQKEYGYNKSTGGGCCTGCRWTLTEEQRANQSAAQKKLHAAGKGNMFKNQAGANNAFYRHQHTEEARRKISASQYKPVVQYDKSGTFVAEYANAYQASLQTGISHVRECCEKQRKTAGGYFWKYKNLEDLSK